MGGEGARKPGGPPEAPAWRSVQVRKQVVVCGGYMRNARGTTGYGVEVEEHELDGHPVDMVAVLKEHYWLLKMVAGEKGVKGDLKECDGLDMVKRRLLEAIEGPTAAADDEGDTPSAAAGEDPMSQLIEATPTPQPGKSRRVSGGHPPGPKRVKTRCVPRRIHVPRQPGGGSEDVQITAMFGGGTHGNRRLLIEAQDVPWLCAYLSAELGAMGVPEPDDPYDAEDQADASAAAGGPGFRLSWSPDGSWIANVTRGPLKGTKLQTYLHQMTVCKWEQGARALGWTKPLHAASKHEQKQALMCWLESTVQQEMAAADAVEASDPSGGSQSRDDQAGGAPPRPQ